MYFLLHCPLSLPLLPSSPPPLLSSLPKSWLHFCPCKRFDHCLFFPLFQLSHPNVVKYLKAFQQSKYVVRLRIVFCTIIAGALKSEAMHVALYCQMLSSRGGGGGGGGERLWWDKFVYEARSFFLLYLEDMLFVIMEYIEGAALAEHFNSLKEKKDKFSEERIWNIFVQVWENDRSELYFCIRISVSVRHVKVSVSVGS